jgi:uncharacterized membrane protein YidH (DUF202 family)
MNDQTPDQTRQKIGQFLIIAGVEILAVAIYAYFR